MHQLLFTAEVHACSSHIGHSQMLSFGMIGRPGPLDARRSKFPQIYLGGVGLGQLIYNDLVWHMDQFLLGFGPILVRLSDRHHLFLGDKNTIGLFTFQKLSKALSELIGIIVKV